MAVVVDQGPSVLNWKQGGVCLRDIARPSYARFNTEYSLVLTKLIKCWPLMLKGYINLLCT